MTVGAKHSPNTWPRVWAERRLDPSFGSIRAQLLAADGFDSAFVGGLDEEAWTASASRWEQELGVTPGCSVFEVGCGAGAFLYHFHNQGCHVGGIDQSASLLGVARSVMPEGDFSLTEAIEVPVVPRADFVLSCSVFEYFPSLEYARTVLERMSVRAKRAVLILDLPDEARKAEALEWRIARAGGPEAYRAAYAGLDHQYYAREWVEDVLRSCGLEFVRTSDQDIPGYGNARFRFNALGRWGRV